MSGFSGRPPASPITASLGANVLLNNIANYFDGPSIAQGTVGTWWVDGTVSVFATTSDVIAAKLWDGTTIIASTITKCIAGADISISLSGFMVNPAGNLRISVRDSSTTSGQIEFNSGNNKDSTISAFRIV